MSETLRSNSIFPTLTKVMVAALAMSGIALASATPVRAQSFQILHAFTGGADGGAPSAALLVGRAGTFTGTTTRGGHHANGTVFRLSYKDSAWRVGKLYDLADEMGLTASTVAQSPGRMYFNTSYAAAFGGPCGAAVQVSRAALPATGRSGVIMRTFKMGNDGCPVGNDFVDSSGNVFGVTQIGGPNGWGEIFELIPASSEWTKKTLYKFRGYDDGGNPFSGMIRDASGNFYGTTYECITGCLGTVYRLSPSGSRWRYKVLYTFLGGNDGARPTAGLIFDKQGDLIGATTSRGSRRGGTIFKLTPSHGSWTFSVLASLEGKGGPLAALTIDTLGRIYGVNQMDGAFGYGSVFRLTETAKGWKYQDLYDFTGGDDGQYPAGGVVLDALGALYGTTPLGGANGFGVIYKIEQ